MSNETRIVDLLMGTKREGMEDLLNWMNDNGFYTAPCSGGNHLAKDGGLLEHSLNVLDLMEDIFIYGPLYGNAEISRESIVICALLHDLGKCGDYGKPGYVPNMIKSRKKDENGDYPLVQSESKPFETNKELAYIPHEVRSVAIAERFISLTEEEEHAIYYHNGKYTHTGYDLKETPLQMLLHFADLWCSRVVEEEIDNGEDRN